MNNDNIGYLRGEKIRSKFSIFDPLHQRLISNLENVVETLNHILKPGI